MDEYDVHQDDDRLINQVPEPEPEPSPRAIQPPPSAPEQEEDPHDDRPDANKYNDNSYASALVRNNLWLGMGYRMTFLRDLRFEVKTKVNLKYETQGLAVGVTVGKVTCHGEQLIGIVKPIVKVHLVALETGLYIKSRRLPPAAPVFTTACPIKNSTQYPAWHQDIIIDANFADVANENSLLLFEILDDKPSLSTARKGTSGNEPERIAKRIAWAYLLPIGVNGEMNIGLSDDWKTSKRKAKSGSADVSRVASHDGEENGPGNGHSNGHSHGSETGFSSPSGKGHNARFESPAEGDRHHSHNHGGSEPHGDNPRNYPLHKKDADKRVRLQLYHYRQYDGVFGYIQRKLMGWPTLGDYSTSDVLAYPNGIPEVYLQWRLLRKVPVFDAYLSMALGPRPGELMSEAALASLGNASSSASNDRSQQELEDELHAQNSRWQAGKHGATKAHHQKSKQELAKIRAAVLRRSRSAREPCVVPEKLLYRLDVGPDGAMSLAFSNSGHILAVACRAVSTSVPLSNQTIIYALRLYDTDSNEEVWTEEAAHHGVIYDLKWSRDDRYLLSCSGDGSAKVWDLLPLLYRSSMLQHQMHSTAAGGGLMSASVNSSKQFGSGGVMSSRDNLGSNNSLTGLYSGRNESPKLLYTLRTSPPAFVYCGVFQEAPTSSTLPPTSEKERLTEIEQATVPRVITGASDGRLRVYDGSSMVGYICVRDKDNPDAEEDDSPHEGQVNSIVIDERSKYMITGDSTGDILAWRCDIKGWYQLLRKFKRDFNDPALAQTKLNNPTNSAVGGVLSLTMHPDKTRGQMLTLSKQPAQLKVFNMSTYKVQCYCSGYSGMSSLSAGGGAFSRANYSADGRYIIAGSSVNQHSSQYRLMVWDSQTGLPVKTTLSEYLFPYPIRAISWHPKQHLFAVSMVGFDAAVAVYAGDKESADKASQRMEGTTGVAASTAAAGLSTIAEDHEGASLLRTSQSSASMRKSESRASISTPIGNAFSKLANFAMMNSSSRPSLTIETEPSKEEQTKLNRDQKTRAAVDKLRQARSGTSTPNK